MGGEVYNIGAKLDIWRHDDSDSSIGFGFTVHGNVNGEPGGAVRVAY